MEAAMRDRTPSFRHRAASSALVACALLTAGPARGDDLFGPEPPSAAAKPALQCPAGAAARTDVQSRIDEIQRLMAASAGGPPADGGPIVLNGAGFNYGPPSHDVDPGALNFEARHAR
jgi:hypothetical protein